jgi:hypothetical protein
MPVSAVDAVLGYLTALAWMLLLHRVITGRWW